MYLFCFVFACFWFTILVYVCVFTYFLDAHILQYILVNLTFLLLLNYSLFRFFTHLIHD